MPDSYRNLARRLLGVADATIGAAVPAASTWLVKRTWVCNSSASAVLVTLNHRLAAEAVSQTNAILQSASIAARSTQVLDEFMMATTDIVSGQASVADVVSVNLYGDLVT